MAAVKPQFRIKKNGDDRFAVDDAIERYQNEIEYLEKKIELYSRQVETATDQLNMIKTRYQSLVTELAVKEKAADDISRMALKEANSIIDTAQNNADSIVREALSTARLILVDVSRLTSEISGMKAEVKNQLTTLQKSLDEFTIPPLPALEWLESQKLIEEERK